MPANDISNWDVPKNLLSPGAEIFNKESPGYGKAIARWSKAAERRAVSKPWK